MTRHRQDLIKKLAQQKGDLTEKEVLAALCSLRDEYNVPIIVIPSKKGSMQDKRGVDVEIRGQSPLHLRIGIDVKSSRAGVIKYRKKQKELISKGIRNAFERYPFLHDRFNETKPDLLLDLLRFIVKKSKTHSDYIDVIPHNAGNLGVTIDDFYVNFRKLVAHIFYKE